MMAPGLDIKDTLRPSITVLSPALGAAFLLRMELSPCPSHLHPWPLSPPRDAVGSACTTLPEQLFLLVSVKADTSHFGRPCLAWTFRGAGLVRPTQDSCTSAHYSFSQEKLQSTTHGAKC